MPNRISTKGATAISFAHQCLVAIACVALLVPPATAESPHAPIHLDARYTGEFLSNRSGGLERDDAFLDNLDITLSLNADALWGWSDTELFVYGLYNNGTKFSETVVGDAQVVSNIETGARAARIYEAWIRTPLGEDTELKFGLYDLNSEFDVLESAQLFPGSAHGIGTDIAQTGRNGPSIFPVAGLGVRVSHSLNERWTLRGAVFDAVPGDPDDLRSSRVRLGGDEGALMIAELEWSEGSSRVLAGAWGYSKRFAEDVVGSGLTDDRHRNYGLYLRGETVPLQALPDVSVFGRIGYAEGKVNVFEYFASAGAAWRGSLLREGDTLGIAFSWAETSAHVEDLSVSAGGDVDALEVAVELTYRVPFGDRFAVQPTLHHVSNPGIDPLLDDALVIALRFEIGLLH